MKDLINTAPLLLQASADIDQVVKAMIKRRVSSALIYDKHRVVVGIVTERDILRKIALLDLDRKLSRKINTIMTRPVEFVRLDHLLVDIKRLHQELALRHFPVLRQDSSATVSNVVGIITVTDIARRYLDNFDLVMDVHDTLQSGGEEVVTNVVVNK